MLHIATPAWVIWKSSGEKESQTVEISNKMFFNESLILTWVVGFFSPLNSSFSISLPFCFSLFLSKEPTTRRCLRSYHEEFVLFAEKRLKPRGKKNSSRLSSWLWFCDILKDENGACGGQWAVVHPMKIWDMNGSLNSFSMAFFSAIPSILTVVQAGLKELETSWIPPKKHSK